MQKPCENLESLFHAAIELPPHEQEHYLNQQCGDNELLRQELRGLLQSHRNAQHFLETPAPALEISRLKQQCAQSVPKQPIGAYHPREVIASGGMGVVYRAWQPSLQREVALKVIRGGANADDYSIRLFNREVRILASMKHPYIASIYEAGHTNDHQHYLAMELVPGHPLHRYVSQHPLTIQQKLKLFVKICEGVGYAHQRGIIHRDLKPSNIVVTEQADPKILDFGLARVIQQDAADASIATRSGHIMGTLNYMSPEQASGQSQLIDVRADQYSLGMILYEMLTGRLPYDIKRMLPHQAINTICQEAPTRPSTYQFALRGDLETIVLKSIEKDPTQRYPSVAMLSEDILRYQSKQPIWARPPSTWYQIRKLISRHKIPFAALGSILALIMGFSLWMSLLYTRADRQTRKATLINTFLQETLSAVNPEQATRQEVTVREALDIASGKIAPQFAAFPDVEATLRETMGTAYKNLVHYEQAEQHYLQALHIREKLYGPNHEVTCTTLMQLGLLYEVSGSYAEAQRCYARALRATENLYGPFHRETAEMLTQTANLHFRFDNYPRAIEYYKQSLYTRRRISPPDPILVARGLEDLANYERANGNYDRSQQLYEQVIQVYQTHPAASDPLLTDAQEKLGHVLVRLNQYDRAEAIYQEVLDRRLEYMHNRHWRIGEAKWHLGWLNRMRGDMIAAEHELNDALSIFEEQLGANHSAICVVLADLAIVYAQTGRADQAEDLIRRAIRIRQSTYSKTHWRVAYLENVLGVCLMQQQRYDEAEATLLESMEGLHSCPDEKRVRLEEATWRLIALYEAWDKPSEANAYREKLREATD